MENMLSMYKIFNWEYFFYLFLAIAIVLGLVFPLLKLDDKPRKIAKISIISAMSFFVILEYIGRIIIIPDFNFGDQMPLNIFQVFVYISIYIFFAKRLAWKKFAYLIIVPVSVYNLIFVPEFYSQGSNFSLAIISYVLINALLIANSILNMIWSGEELEKRNILDASMTYVIIVAFIHIWNVFLRFTFWGVHANYFGTMGEEYDILIKWLSTLIPVPFVFLLPLIAILIGIQFLLVLPFDLVKTKRKRQEHIDELIALGNLKAQQEYRDKNKKTKSQILVKGDKKAQPKEEKNITHKSSTSFVTTTKEIKIHKSDSEK